MGCQHGNDAAVRVVEVDVDTKAYNEAHVPGAIAWAWNTQLCDTVRRDILSQQQFEALMARFRRHPRHHAGDLRRQQQLVRRLGLLAGENLRTQGRPPDERRPQEVARRRPRRSLEPPAGAPRNIGPMPPISPCAPSCPMCRLPPRNRSAALVDVRSPQEFTGEILAPPGLPETCQRGGHIPGARSIPWGKACNDDGTFKSADELRALYGGKASTAPSP